MPNVARTMTKINDGGPAFPTDVYWEEKRIDIEGGLSKRDVFAALAMHAEIITTASDLTPKSCDALIEEANVNERDVIDQIAVNAYKVADAMIRARLVAAEVDGQ